MNCNLPWISKTGAVLWIFACCFCLSQMGCDVDTSYQKRLTDVIHDDTIYLRLHSSAGWELIVFPEGSGRLSFTSSRVESLTFPKGTFNYKKLIGEIIERLSQQKTMGKNAIGVTFGLPNIDYAEVEFLADHILAKSVFDKAYTAVISSKAPIYNKRRLKKRYRKRPPVE